VLKNSFVGGVLSFKPGVVQAVIPFRKCWRLFSSLYAMFLWQVNELDRVAVNVHIYSYSKTTMPVLPPVWSTSPEAKFNIISAISEAAHRMRGLEYRPANDYKRQ